MTLTKTEEHREFGYVAYGYDTSTTTTDGTTTSYYFSASDQVLEERVGGSSSVSIQYVWGLRYVNDLVLRDANTGSGGNLGIDDSGLSQRLYVLQDVNWNVVALVNTCGTVVERYTYTAYGTVIVRNPDFSVESGGTAYAWTILFAGEDVDKVTGLSYNDNRWYVTSLGVFTATDAAQSNPNAYTYALDNPNAGTDPSGNEFDFDWEWDPDIDDFVDTHYNRTLSEEVEIEEDNDDSADAAANAARISRTNEDSEGNYDADGYWYYLTHTSKQDTDLKYESYASWTVAAIASALAGGIAAVGSLGFGGTVATAGAAGVGLAETPEGQALVGDAENMANEEGPAIESEAEALYDEATNAGESAGNAPDAGASITNVNPTNSPTNCVNSSIATDATLAGNNASALPSDPQAISVLEDTFGGTFQPVSGPMQIGSILTQNGDGARGIVFGESPLGDVGHVWNAVNDSGVVQFIDGQVGASGLSNFENMQNFQFLLTHGNGG